MKNLKAVVSLFVLFLSVPHVQGGNGIITITFGKIDAVDFADIQKKDGRTLKAVSFRGDFSVDGDTDFSEHPDTVKLVYDKAGVKNKLAVAQCLKKGLGQGRVYMNFSASQISQKKSDSFQREYEINLDHKQIQDFGCEEFVVARRAFEKRRTDSLSKTNFNDYIGTVRLRHEVQSYRSFSW